MIKTVFITSVALFILSACEVTRPLSLSEARLSPCPWTPNCVSTEATSDKKRIEPFELIVDIDTAWSEVVLAVESLEGVVIKNQRLGYLYAKVISSTFRFVDYIEVLYVPSKNRLAVRSAARLGISDMGVNRKRTQHLRSLLRDKNLIR